jgi:hypothetical protein
MLTGEALFGVAGLVTAPLLYPFFKREIGRIWSSTHAPLNLAVMPAMREGPARRVDNAEPEPTRAKAPAETVDRS